MKTIDQWRFTLRWTVRLSLGFFLIYAASVLIKAPIVYGEIKNVFPEEMKEDFIGMAIVAPFIFTLIFFIGCFAVLRLVLFFYGTWRKLNSNHAVQPTR
jgi:membrane-anchored glycerophosphoryl diester phosphodiesterase (GDPDase)